MIRAFIAIDISDDIRTVVKEAQAWPKLLYVNGMALCKRDRNEPMG
jgi:hypothetical protein